VIARRLLWRLLAALVCAAGLLRPLPLAAQPETASIGIYIGSIHNLDFTIGKFTADIWIWSVSGDHDDQSPLETAYIVNEAGKSAVDSIRTVRKNGKRWDQRRIRADLWANWQVGRFPFDTQTLTVELEEAFLSTDKLVYAADLKNSGLDDSVSIPGWQITGWEVRAEDASYESNFGDPDNPNGTRYARLVFSVTAHRNGLTTFIDQTLGAFLAFGVLVLSFRLLPIVPPIFGARMVIIVGSMFTAMTSMRALGSSFSFAFGETLPTRVHLLTLGAGFVAAFAAVVARYIVECGNEARALRLDRWALVLFTISYVVIVGAEIVHAVYVH
jgi:hypothetical protein